MKTLFLILAGVLALALSAQTGSLSAGCSLCQPGPIQFIATGLETNKTYYVCPGNSSSCLLGARGSTSHTWTAQVFTPGAYVATLRTMKGNDWVIVSSASYQVE